MSSRALGFARPLVQRDHQVKLFMPPWQTADEADRSWREDGVELRYTPLKGGPIGIARQLIRETFQWEPDVVHCFKPKAYSGLVAWWIWQFHKKRVRLIVDSDDWEGAGGWNSRAPYSPAQKKFFSWQEQWGMSHCHTLTVASRTLESIAWSQGIEPKRVIYLPNGAGIALDGSAAPSETVRFKRQELGIGELPILLLYSRLFEFDTARLVKILAAVKAAVPDVAIISIGESLFASDRANMRYEIGEAGLTDAIIDLGWVALDHLPHYLGIADVGIYLMDDTLINRTKCPVKLADMIAMGIPVVAESVGQVSEYILNGQSGILHPTGDVTNIINDIVNLLQDESKRRRMSANAREHYWQTFSWRRLAVRLEQAYG
ncbi:MAG: glycosyltransferase family 4 protein [Candidatus Promineifilaceae bacterium]|nr:glycosyltransferase family 4 protein [Candidatus Promineifilaceae bacterium]